VTVFLTISYADRDRGGWARTYRNGKIQQLSHRDEEGNERRYERTGDAWTLSVFDAGGNLLWGPAPAGLPRDAADAAE
jgi:hypothetical protein